MIPGIIQIARKGTSLHMRVCVSVLVGGGGGGYLIWNNE